MSCEHGRTHKEEIFIDLEDDGSMSYDIYEVCDNPECESSWLVGDFEDNGETLAEQMGLKPKVEEK